MTNRVGSLKKIGFSGQDPKRHAQIEAQLFSDFKPKDVLEEIWLSDIAALTAAIEYYRQLEVNLNENLLEKHGIRGDSRSKTLGPSDIVEDALEHAELVSQIRFEAALGKFNEQDLKKINMVIEMINKLRRERERIYNQFERKRRPALINAVKYQEVSSTDDASVEVLAD